jgi:hypothetical protein
MILKKFLQSLLAIMGERSGRIQLMAGQFLMATGGSKGSLHLEQYLHMSRCIRISTR